MVNWQNITIAWLWRVRKKDVSKITLQFLAWATKQVEIPFVEMEKSRGKGWRSVLDMTNFKCLWVIHIKRLISRKEEKKVCHEGRGAPLFKSWGLEWESKHAQFGNTADIKDFSKSSFNGGLAKKPYGLGQRMNGKRAIKAVHSFPKKAVYEKK